MQPQPTPTPIVVRHPGVLVVDGYGIQIHVDHGRLVVRDGIGRSRREAKFARATCPVRRLVLVGHTGSISLDAFRWMADVGIGFVHLDSDGRLLIASGGLGLDDPRLRRAQALAFGSEAGTRIARDLLMRKLAGQARVARLLAAPEVAQTIDLAGRALDEAVTPAELMVPEAAAATAYWDAWASITLRWTTKDAARVPDHWRTFRNRASPLTGNPRSAADPVNGLLNYGYSVAEAAARLSLLAIGLDPGMGVLHADLRARDSLALDVMEAVRPDVDLAVIELLRTRTFRATDFVERRDGGCRILPPLTHELIATLPTWESRLGPLVEAIARAFAASPGSRIHRVPTLLTGRNKSRRADVAPTTSRGEPVRLVGRTCATCGGAVPSRKRRYCDVCLPEAVAAQRAELNGAGVAELKSRRAAGTDPSHTGQATADRASKVSASRMAAAEWRRVNGPEPDPEGFKRDVMPRLRGLSARRLAEVTGLSRPYCDAILRGAKVPHPRWWDVLRAASRTEGRT